MIKSIAICETKAEAKKQLVELQTGFGIQLIQGIETYAQMSVSIAHIPKGVARDENQFGLEFI